MTHLSLLQRYLLLALVFAVSLTPLLYFACSTYYRMNRLLELNIQGNKYQYVLKKLLHTLPHHQRLKHQSLQGQAEGEQDLKDLSGRIDSYFDQLIQFPLDESLDKRLLDERNEAFRDWKRLANKQAAPTIEENRHIHQEIIEHIKKIFHSLGTYHHLNEKDLSSSLILPTLIELPHLQSLLYQTTYGIGEALFDSPSPQVKNEFNSVLTLLEFRLKDLKANLDRAFKYSEINQQPFNTAILSTFNIYYQAAQELMQTLDDNLFNRQTSPLSSKELIGMGNGVIISGLKVWDLTNEEIESQLMNQQNNLRSRFWLLTFLTSALTISAFFWGLSMCLKSMQGLERMTHAVHLLTEGQTMVRVPIVHQYEYDKLGEAVNQLALRLHETGFQFHELLRGIQTLTDGDLSVRLQSDPTNKEFAHVVSVFNQMAQSYESIIGRLQQLGFMLTNSASHLSSASKEQETIVIQQENTTREIAIAANEISTTAQEFARTLKNISHSAEQTSTLASAGKTSLSNMESIMRQMVNASSNIAAKLAILNEKAGNITSVITTITKVADQTNLLSLNASIEAEKAGEYGRSFAVIAREIRRLADQTAVSTLDIEKMINEIMTAVSSSVMGVDDFTQEIRNGVEQVAQVSGQLTTIIEQVQNFIAKFEMVNEGMQAQSMGAEQINEALTELSQTAQHAAYSIHQFHQTIEELNTAAMQLRTLVPHLHTSLKKVL